MIERERKEIEITLAKNKLEIEEGLEGWFDYILISYERFLTLSNIVTIFLDVAARRMRLKDGN